MGKYYVAEALKYMVCGDMRGLVPKSVVTDSINHSDIMTLWKYSLGCLFYALTDDMSSPFIQ